MLSDFPWYHHPFFYGSNQCSLVSGLSLISADWPSYLVIFYHLFTAFSMSLSRSVGVLTSLSLSLLIKVRDSLTFSLSLSLISQRFLTTLSLFRFEWFERPNLSPRGVWPRGESEIWFLSLSFSQLILVSLSAESLSLSRSADGYSWLSHWLSAYDASELPWRLTWRLCDVLWRHIALCDVLWRLSLYRIVSIYFGLFDTFLSDSE